MHLLGQIPILILLLYLLVSIDLVYTGIRELGLWNLSSKVCSNFSGKRSFSATNNCQC